MSVHAPREPRHGGGRWDAVISALDSWPRTFRLCLIWLVAIAAPVTAAVLAELIRHMLLYERSAAYGAALERPGPDNGQPSSPSHQSNALAGLLTVWCP
jgi:hypothetical protein